MRTLNVTFRPAASVALESLSLIFLTASPITYTYRRGMIFETVTTLSMLLMVFMLAVFGVKKTWVIDAHSLWKGVYHHPCGVAKLGWCRVTNRTWWYNALRRIQKYLVTVLCSSTSSDSAGPFYLLRFSLPPYRYRTCTS